MNANVEFDEIRPYHDEEDVYKRQVKVFTIWGKGRYNIG